jgi:hypothetical protein
MGETISFPLTQRNLGIIASSSLCLEEQPAGKRGSLRRKPSG